MDHKIVDCFFIVEASSPLKPAMSQSQGPPPAAAAAQASETEAYTTSELLSRPWEGKITYEKPVLTEDDLPQSTWIVNKQKQTNKKSLI